MSQLNQIYTLIAFVSKMHLITCSVNFQNFPFQEVSSRKLCMHFFALSYLNYDFRPLELLGLE